MLIHKLILPYWSTLYSFIFLYGVALERCAEYVLSLNDSTIAPEAKTLAKTFFIDCLGCMIAGAHGRPSQIAMDYCEKTYGTEKRDATILATGGKKLNVCSAAFINGISSHFHDYDDVLPTLNGHPSAAVLPAVLALGECENVSGNNPMPAFYGSYEKTVLLNGDEPCWYETRDRFIPVNGDFQLKDGIKLLLTPGHSPGSQSVAVNTERGIYLIAGDCIPLYESWEVKLNGYPVPGGILTDMKAFYQSFEKIEKESDFILPGHDYRVLDHFVYPPEVESVH